MTNKSVILTLLAFALGFGVLISGCNRDRSRTAMRTNRHEQIRPAEVLSASAYRPPVRSEPAYYAGLSPVNTSIRVIPLPPAQAPAPAYYQQQPVMVYPTPQLAVAQASVPVHTPPPPRARQMRPAPGPAPIPELEPARYSGRLARADTRQKPPAPVMMSAGFPQPDRRRSQPVPAPMNQPELQPLPYNGWVASPATAMRSGGYY